MKSKSLLIIGGSGFIGKSIISFLLSSDFSKIKINKIFILSRGKLNINLKNIKLKKKIKIIKINFDLLKIKELPITDYVIYAAILKNFNKDHEAVKNYTYLAKKYHFKSKILYLSSGAVYGKLPKNKLGFSEDYLKFNKKKNYKYGYKKEYSIIKLKNEKCFKKLAETGIKISIARCFTFVGQYLPKNSTFVINEIIKKILSKKKIIIKSDYKVVISFMHADDMVCWLLEILNKSNTSCPIYNVGSDDYVDIRELAFFLGKKYNLNVKTKSLNQNYIDRYFPRIYKAKKELNLCIKYNSFDAVQNIIDGQLK
jgi:nucleoside-diphosphate-sugar epimerase